MNMAVCRYNPNHKMKPSRLLIHEQKCPDRLKKQDLYRLCPYNPNHKIEKEKYEQHILVCENKPKITLEEQENIERARQLNDIADEKEQIRYARMKYYKDCVQEPEIPGISQNQMKKNKEKVEKKLKKKFKEVAESEGRFISEIADKDYEEINNGENNPHEFDNIDEDFDIDIENDNKKENEIYFYRYNPNDEDKDVGRNSANVINPEEIKRILKEK